MSDFNKLPNRLKSKYYKDNHLKWKKEGLENQGYFIIFNSFVRNKILTRISGSALKLYIYLGSFTDNHTGECWVSIETIAKYFDRSPRSVSYWIKELEDLNLIRRMQFMVNGPSHTFLQPYTLE